MLHSRLLRYLDEVARSGSIRKAGHNLNIAAPAINRQILALEQELGTPIFERHPRKMVLTAAGEILIDHVRQTLRAMDRTQSAIEELKGLRRGEISLAMVSGLAATLTPLAIAKFRAAHQRVKINVALVDEPEILKRLSAGEADLGLAFDLKLGARVQLLASTPSRLGVVVSPRHPLASKASLRVSDCVGYSLCIPDRSMTMRTHIDAVFAEASIEPEPFIETNAIEVMRHMAMTENCVTFLSQFDVHFERANGQLVYIPLKGLKLPPETLMLVGNARRITPLARAMAENFKEVMETLR
ncbi:LysR family transcriptional regulator [Parvibaculum sedimenti]|uniref:LysR family transcriptional regulator n=1 Tax=Parvibaculum sedimenti TaxID=2608632 RepID=A0A6N6VLQ8_9HYPH|nr:LysR family transcriptional regulator [Parvibaculum sedimenti]KAB7739889.1 LysR family transcriptional regulator [Parvibaculum sedimenti]